MKNCLDLKIQFHHFYPLSQTNSHFYSKIQKNRFPFSPKFQIQLHFQICTFPQPPSTRPLDDFDHLFDHCLTTTGISFPKALPKIPQNESKYSNNLRETVPKPSKPPQTIDITAFQPLSTAHNPKVVGSNPASATIKNGLTSKVKPFLFMQFYFLPISP